MPESSTYVGDAVDAIAGIDKTLLNKKRKNNK